MLISVHMPKTAGTSFERSLRQHFGKRLVLRYADKPLHHAPVTRNLRAAYAALRNLHRGENLANVECIHGHFLPVRYRFLPAQSGVRFITWLRDPVDRLLSHYHHWQRVEPNTEADTLHIRMRDEQWSFEQFALRRELRNLYQAFLWGFPIERFDFIGVTEHYASDLEIFSRRFLGQPLVAVNANRNPDREERSGSTPYAIDPHLRKTLEEIHAADVGLYRFALQQRLSRLTGT